MNKAYRLKQTRNGNLVAVPECARGRGKGTGRLALGLTVLVLGAASGGSAWAQGIVVNSGNTQVYNAPNGVPVVDIATTNGAGLSHNRFTQYNVDNRGVVLNNNAPHTQAGPLQSQLAGQVVPNVNLSTEARIILNEVVVANRSTLAGYTEVLGKTADVVVANPWGITCSGCGFINTDRVTLTTGAPVIGTGGNLDGFRVNQGDILVQGDGLDGRNQNVLDLVARTVKLDGQINARDLQVVAGANEFSYATRETTALAASGAAPAYAIDASALGGMYANRIRLLATEAGVGVRMLGEAAATADDFTLTADGKIEIRGKLSAERDVAVTYTGPASGGAAALEITGSGAELAARRDIALTVHNGAGATLSEAKLTAGRDLSLSTATLTDSGATANTRFAGNDLTVTASDAAGIDGSTWGAGNRLSMTVASLAIGGNGATLYSGADADAADRSLNLTATSGNINLANAALTSSAALNLTATLGGIQTGSGGVLQAGGGASLAAATTINHAGTLASAASIDLVATDASATLVNSGRIEAADNLTLGASGHVLDITNQTGGVLLAGDALAIQGGAVFNAGAIQAATGTQLTAASLNNQSGATFVASTSGGGTDSLQLSGAFANQGTVQSAQALALSTTGLTNASAGKLLASGDLTLTTGASASNAGEIIGQSNINLTSTQSNFTLTNSGRLQSSGDLTLGDSGHLVALTNAATGIIRAGEDLQLTGGALDNQGKISSTAALTLATAALTNGGAGNANALIMSGGNSQIAASGALNNYGAVHANGASTIQAAGITNRNTGGISSLTTLALSSTAANAIDNYGALYAGSALSLTASGGSIFNRPNTGTLDSNGTITTQSAHFTNNNSIVATGNINIDATASFTNQTNASVSKTWGSIFNVLNWIDWKIANEGSFDKGMNAWVHEDDFSRREELVGMSESALAALPKAQIIATGSGSALTIHYGGSGLNHIAVLSAPTVNISGSGTFTNQDMTLHQYEMRRRWIEIADESSGDDDFAAWARTNPNRDGWDGDPDDDDNNWDDWNPGSGWTWVEHDEGDSFPGWLRDDARAAAIPGAIRIGASVVTRFGAGIYAGTFNFSGGTLNNVSSPYPNNPSEARVGGAQSASITSVSASAPDAATVSGATPLSLGGVNISLPTNPNGYFVVSRDPSARYLVETNPLFAVGANFVGSNYLAERYGYNPDDIQRRLGDANYEAYLIRQQLINQTGSNLLRGYGDEAGQMRRLMDQAVTQGAQLGFEWGKPLTTAQIAGLTQDIVWMEEVVVNGQRVLAPRVYLAPTTVASLLGGAVIAADDVNIAGDALNNTGGTIEGSNTLTVSTTGDITNTSGTLRGGDVSLTSTEGSIVNQTVAEGAGDSYSYATTIGKTAGIEATGNLNLDAKQDITVIGADVKAGGDATLSAGGNITFDTIVDKTATTTGSSTKSLLGDSWSTTTTTTETNIGSNLQVGANLKLNSGGDTTLAGSKAEVGGNLDVETGGDFNVIARQDKVTTHTEEKTTGVGVGGGVYGAEKTTTDSFKGTNVGSTLNVGGNATVNSAGSMTLQGSDMTVAGDADIQAARGINILDGLDEERTTTRTETTTFFKVDSGGESASGSESGSDSASAMGRAGAGAGASANAEAGGSGDVKLYEKTITTTRSGSTTSVASNLAVGGNLKAKTEGTLTIQGSNVESGGNMDLDAKNVEILAGRNTEWTHTETTRSSIGIYSEGNASANAEAQAQARAGTMGTNADASAGAAASAEGVVTIGARIEQETSTSYKLTHTGSTLKSGGSMNIRAQETAEFVGAQVESGGDMNIEGKNIINRAAQDVEIHTTSSTTQTMGLYAGGDASVEGGAQAEANNMRFGKTDAAEAGGEASANVSAGLRYSRQESSSVEGAVTNVVSTFKAGGNLTRTASDTIEDHGTQLEAGGNIEQSAREIREVAVEDSTFSSSQSSSHDARIGVGASVGGELKASSSGETESDSGAGAGFRASYSGSFANANESSSTAVTTRYKAGGNIVSSSKEKTTLIGTQMEAGGDITLEAGELDFKAAQDKTSSSSTSHDVSAQAKIDTVGTPGGSLEAGWEMNKESESGTTARTGSLSAGGNLTVKTRGNASFEGTQLEAGDQAAIEAGGNVEFKAARDTADSQSSNASASLELSAEKAGKKAAGVEGGYSQASASSRSAQVAGIKAGAGGIVVRAGGNADFEGTQMESAGDTNIRAGGDVNLRAAKNTETSVGFGVSAELGAERSDEGSKDGFGVSANASYANKVDSSGTAIRSGGKVVIQGQNVINQEAEIEAAGGRQVIGNEIKTKAENRDIAVGIDIKVAGENEKSAPAGSAGKASEGGKREDNPSETTRQRSNTDKPRAKTTDDLPTTQGAQKTDDRQATIKQLQADKVKLDAALGTSRRNTPREGNSSQ